MTTLVYSGGGIPGDWADPKNWTGGRAPGMTDNVQILNGTSTTVDGRAAVNAIMIVRGGTDTFTGSVTTAGVGNYEGFTVSVGSTVVFNPGSSLHDGGDAASLNGGGVLQVGVGGLGNFIANGSAAFPTTISDNDATIGVQAAGVGTVTINDATWTTAQVLEVGRAGAGTVDVNTGGVINVVGGLLVGEEAGGVGTLDIRTGGKVNVHDSLVVGGHSGSTGTLNVDAGGQVKVGGSLSVSAAKGASGTLNLFSGATLTVLGDAAIGNGNLASPQGVGKLTIDAGSNFDVADRISVSGGSTVEVAGGTVSAGSLVVGMTGAGTFDVEAGSHINLSKSFAMGAEAGAAGTATLLSGSTVTVNGSASIGAGDAASPLGTGSLTVDSASTFSARGSLSISSGSILDVAGGKVSAAVGGGSVTVEAGGKIAGYGTLATRAGGFLTDNGKIVANGGTLQLDGKVSGTGSVIINPDSTVAITGSSLLTPTLTFMSGTGETLSLATAANVHSTISGFAIGDQIEMADIDKAVWSSAADTLTLSDAGKTVSTLHLSGNYSSDVFSLTHTAGLAVITLHSA